MLNKGNQNDLSNVIFHVREDDEWNVVNLDQLMDDKTILVFGLPGAFTPTCSTQQLPGYEAMYDQFIESGVDGLKVKVLKKSNHLQMDVETLQEV